MKKSLLNTVMLSILTLTACFMLAGCIAGKSAKNIEIVDSGFSSNENGDYTYAIEFKNCTDKVMDLAVFDVKAYDKNGNKLKPTDQWFSVVKTVNVRPGERAACTMMMKHKIQENESDGIMAFESVPADIQFSRSFETSFRATKPDDVDLSLVDYEMVDNSMFSQDYFYDEDFVAFKVRIANNGKEDFIFDPHDEKSDIYMCCNVVYRDADGKVIGGAGDLSYTSWPMSDDSPLIIKAGKETECYFTGPYRYWPSAGQDLYIEASRY